MRCARLRLDQPGGLILSAGDLAAAKEYKQAMDQLNDTWQAIAITIESR